MQIRFRKFRSSQPFMAKYKVLNLAFDILTNHDERHIDWYHLLLNQKDYVANLPQNDLRLGCAQLLHCFEISRIFHIPDTHGEKRWKFLNLVKIGHIQVVLIVRFSKRKCQLKSPKCQVADSGGDFRLYSFCSK